MPRPKTLSYALNKKTDKLLKANNQKGADLAIMLPVGCVAGLLLAYFLGNMDRFLDAWVIIFSGEASEITVLTPVESVMFNVFFVASAIFGFLYALWTRHNDKFKKYKKEVLEILEADPCEHHNQCTCKDDYCSWIEDEEGVDLL